MVYGAFILLHRTSKHVRCVSEILENRQMNKLEREIEKKCRGYAQSKGAMLLKLKLANENGFPDRTLKFKYGTVIFIEFKKPGGKLRPEQRDWIRRLNEEITCAYWVDTFEMFKDIFDYAQRNDEKGMI